MSKKSSYIKIDKIFWTPCRLFICMKFYLFSLTMESFSFWFINVTKEQVFCCCSWELVLLTIFYFLRLWTKFAKTAKKKDIFCFADFFSFMLCTSSNIRETETGRLRIYWQYFSSLSRGTMFMLCSSWNSSLQAYGILKKRSFRVSYSFVLLSVYCWFLLITQK